ncbi:MAG TPA: hypothetical protein VE981_08785 [Planctomycetota bacterium]|nr:hypothetical protein [Planctomycetota bacterium]
MMLTTAFLLFCVPTAAGDERDLDLASALARRGWLDLADDVCGKIDRLPGASFVLAEVAAARARQEPDPAAAARILDAAAARFGATPTLDERAMIGELRVQKARQLSETPDGARAWEAVESFYRESIAGLKKMAASPAVEEALLDARLELPKAMAAHARIPSTDAAARKKMLADAVPLFLDFQLECGNAPIAYEAVLEEGRARLDLGDTARAERCFRAVLALRKNSAPLAEYPSALWDGALLSLLKTLTQAGKAKDAVAGADAFLRGYPARAKTAMGLAMTLARAEALAADGNLAGALATAQGVVNADANGPAGHAAREKIRGWMKGEQATPDRMMLIADGMIDPGLYREALTDLRRVVELCRGEAELRQFEPVAAFKRGESFRALKQDLESSIAFQEVFRRYPAHTLAGRAAFEAVRSQIRSAAATRDPKDEERQEQLLAEIRRLGLQGAYAGFFKFLEAERLERKGQWRAAAEAYETVDEGCEVYDDALVSAGHCWKRDVDAKGDPKQLQKADALLRRAVSRLEKVPVPRLLVGAYYDLASIHLHKTQNQPKEALGFVRKCAALLPADSEMQPRLAEMEIRARLGVEDADGAGARLDALLKTSPDHPASARSARRVAWYHEAAEPSKAARYYRVWLDATEAALPSIAETREVADGLVRMARVLNRFDDRVVSVLDLRGQPVPDRVVWKDAVRAQSRLLALVPPESKERPAAASRLAWCLGFAAETAPEWGQCKSHCEGLVKAGALVGPEGINASVLQNQKWLAGIYLEYGHALYQLGRSGQKFQFGNAITVFNHLKLVAEKESEPWWICTAMSLKALFERGEGSDITTVEAALSILELNHSDFDAGKHRTRALLIELRDQVQAVRGSRR